MPLAGSQGKMFISAWHAQHRQLVLHVHSIHARTVWGDLGQVSWSVCLLAAKGSQAMPVLSTVEAQLSLHNVAKEP